MNNIELSYILIYVNKENNKKLIVAYDTEHLDRLYPNTLNENDEEYKLEQRIVMGGLLNEKFKWQGLDYINGKKQEY